jgi:hypothetical protein
MSKTAVVLALALAVIGLAAPRAARAEDPTFEGLGHAPIAGGDRVRARERALDEAVRQAVELATTTLLDPDQLVARASELKLRVYPKARAYVATYRVLEELEQPPGTFEVHIAAQVATARLLADLTSTAPVAPSAPPRAGRVRALACVEPKGEEAARIGRELAHALEPVLGARGVDAVWLSGACA